MAERSGVSTSGRVRLPRKCRISNYDRVGDELRAKLKKIGCILKKEGINLTAEENDILAQHPDMVKTAKKKAELRASRKERDLEIEDAPEVLQTKCESLANAIKKSKKVVVYTGAGISTAASIPDYRGPNGVWTLLKQGKELRALDLSDAEPTLTHMCITKLYKLGHVKHVVSQNCDGLHLRSGLPRRALSELHGNMYIEKCKSCRPHKEYIRLFDVTERTAVRRHGTGRFCGKCGGELRDTIIHFGERGELNAPYRWLEAACAADNADIILCLGSSLKILRRYTILWCMDKRPQNRPKLYVVNLQWTPKDDVATLKINGRCDDVMKLVMHHLGVDVQPYRREADPIFRFATQLTKDEYETTSKKILEVPEMVKKKKEFIRKTKGQGKTEPEEDEDTKVPVKLEADPSSPDDLEEEKPAVDCSGFASLQPLPASTLSVAPLTVGVVPAEVGVVSANVEVGSTVVGVVPGGVGVVPAGVGVAPAGVGVVPAGVGMAPAGVGVVPAGVGVAPAGAGEVPASVGVAPEGLMPIWSSGGNILVASSALMCSAPLLPIMSPACLTVQPLSSAGQSQVFVSALGVAQNLSPASLPAAGVSGEKAEASDAQAPMILQDHCYCRHGKGGCADASTLPHPVGSSDDAHSQVTCSSLASSSISQGLLSMQTSSSSNSGGGGQQSCCSASEPQSTDSEAADAQKDQGTDSGEDESKATAEAARGSKRKVTVPGWFGKGLTFKRRKKHF